MRWKWFLIVAVASAMLTGGAWYHMRENTPAVEWQGWIEGDYLFIAPDEAGRLTSLDVARGQDVAQGARLFSVQSDIQDAAWQQAAAALAEAKAHLARAEAAQQRPEEIAVLESQEAAAKAAIQQSRPEFERAKELVGKGVAAQSRLDAAKAAFERDTAALSQVQRQIGVGRLRARTEDIDAAKDVVAQAEAALASAETRRQQRNVAAPASGLVQEVYYRQGEIVPAGRPVLSLLPPANLKVRFFVPEPALPSLRVGDRILVSCDGCQGNIEAEISFLSTQAQFTPPVIYSLEERAKLVYRVEARPLHPELLHVGQPVTVRLRAETREKPHG